jgi:hypothetical protein
MISRASKRWIKQPTITMPKSVPKPRGTVTRPVSTTGY